MFYVFRLRLFIAKVQAELKAQYDDQDFVNRICQIPTNMEALATIKDSAYFRKEKVAPFLAVCHVLGESMYSEDLAQEERTICASLLAQRLEKVDGDPHFRMIHLMVFGDLEEKIMQWASENEIA